jgi:hypothetical protein
MVYALLRLGAEGKGHGAKIGGQGVWHVVQWALVSVIGIFGF